MEEKILILSCGTGEGHNSAAKALTAVFEARGIRSETADVLKFKSERAPQKISALYSTAMKRFPHLFGFIYHVGALYDKLRLPSPVYALNAGYAEKLYRYIAENNFSCVVCTHLFAMEAMTAVRRKYGATVRCYGVLTDHTMHPFIKDTELDGYFVPDTEVVEQLIQSGVKGMIACKGIPVHPGFLLPVSKREARRAVALPDDKKIVAVMMGGAGCGKIEKLCKALLAGGENGLLVLAFTGRNKKLQTKLAREFAGDERVKAIPFTSDVAMYMKAADVVVTKAGGLSSTEIAAANVPIVHLKAMPGLEPMNLKYFSERGLSVRADSVSGAAAKVRSLLRSPETREKMLIMQRIYIDPHASEKIVDEILKGENKYVGVLDDPVYCGRLFVGERALQPNHSESISA